MISSAANDNGRCAAPRDAARDIGKLATSGHVEAGGALPISQRVQTSGRGEPQPTRWSAEGERAQRILGRGYAAGGDARRYALALWLMYAYEGQPTPMLAMALGVVLRTEHERHETIKHWWSWATGGSASTLIASAVDLTGRAVGWYETASEEPGCAGMLARLVADADAVRSGALPDRLREWHRAWVAGRTLCPSINKRVRCPSSPRTVACERPDGGACCAVELVASGGACAPYDDECGCEWLARCAA